MDLKKLYLKKNEGRRIQAGHLWVYSNEVDTHRSPLKNFQAGELIHVLSAKDIPLGVGYINPHMLICARLLSTNPDSIINEDFFIQKFTAALQLREMLYNRPFYRLIFAESDDLPGLIVDRYDQVFVMQNNTAGMDVLKPLLVSALQKVFSPLQIVLKNASNMRELEGLEKYVAIESGSQNALARVIENDVSFEIPILEGQKTGWFYDHRENRARLKKYCQDKKVLDLFSYLGGWGIQAALFGAKEVTCVDSSAKAISYAKENAKLNAISHKMHYQEADVFDALKSFLHQKETFDLIILDPPAFIKKRKDIEQGIIAYLRLNELALQLLSENGILISCSCSLHLPQEQLTDIIRRASLKTKRKTRILEVGLQGMDHPIHPAIPETAYLKALFCFVTT